MNIYLVTERDIEHHEVLAVFASYASADEYVKKVVERDPKRYKLSRHGGMLIEIEPFPIGDPDKDPA